MQTVCLLFPGNCEVSVPNRIRMEFFPTDVHLLSPEKRALIQESKNVIYRIGDELETCYIEFVVKSKVIEPSNSFLGGQLRMHSNYRGAQEEIFLTLNLDPYCFPTIFAYLNAVFCDREIPWGSMIGSNAAAFHSILDFLQINADLSARERYSQLLLELKNDFHVDNLEQSAEFLLGAAQVMFEPHSFAPTDYFGFQSSFINFEDFNQMEKFARRLLFWLRDIPGIMHCPAVIHVHQEVTEFFFNVPQADGIHNPRCMGRCIFSKVFLRTVVYWYEPNTWRYMSVQGQPEVYRSPLN